MEVNMNPLQKQMLDDVFDAFTMLTNGSIVTLMHVDGGFTRYSSGAVELFGLPGEYIPNGAMDWADYLHPEDVKRYMDVMMPLLSGESQTYDITYRVRTASGRYGNFRAVGAVLRGENGKPSLIGGAMFNEGLTNNTDPVTVLPNKNAFQEDLERRMKKGTTLFALQIGISKLSEINQRYGYTFGNRILQEIAWLLQETVKERGSVYRADGASFLILFEAVSREEIAAIYDHVRYRLQRGIQVNGIRNILTANGGLISSFGMDVEAASLQACLSYAYEESKQRMHGELVDFNGSVNYEGAASLELINTIRDCAANGCEGFFLEYHPVIDARTERMNGAEATICWQNETWGRVAPEDFLPILERDFIFEELGDFMLEQGLRDGVRFLETMPDFLLCLNVYRIQMESNYFIDTLSYYLNESGFPPELLSLKFNSDCRLLGLDRMREIIDRLHDRGILAIIGDFGSGTDSIGFLKNEPVDAVSLGSEFIGGIGENERERDILEHLTKMAAACVRHINVKGVDSLPLREILRDFPVTTMQGALFSEVLSAEKVIQRYGGRP